jgi:hypothetical protein
MAQRRSLPSSVGGPGRSPVGEPGALIWLIAQVLPSVAESLVSYCCAEADG